MIYVYARWSINGEELPDDLNDVHISNGVGDEQFDAFDLNRPESKLTVTGFINGYDVELIVFGDGIEKEKDYWLSPSLIGGTEAHAFGLYDSETDTYTGAE